MPLVIFIWCCILTFYLLLTYLVTAFDPSLTVYRLGNYLADAASQYSDVIHKGTRLLLTANYLCQNTPPLVPPDMGYFLLYYTGIVTHVVMRVSYAYFLNASVLATT